MSLGRIHHIDISEDTVSESLEKVKEKLLQDKSRSGLKISWDFMRHSVKDLCEEDHEFDFLDKLNSEQIITKRDVESVASNDGIIEAIMENISKQHVYLFRGSCENIDSYLQTDEDKFIDRGDEMPSDMIATTLFDEKNKMVEYTVFDKPDSAVADVEENA